MFPDIVCDLVYLDKIRLEKKRRLEKYCLFYQEEFECVLAWVTSAAGGWWAGGGRCLYLGTLQLPLSGRFTYYTQSAHITVRSAHTHTHTHTQTYRHTHTYRTSLQSIISCES